MKNFEKQQSRLDDQKFIDNFFDVYADELEKTATKPGNRLSEDELEFVNKFRKSKKLPKGDRLFRGLFIRVGQDFRLTPDEIDALEDRFFE